MIAEAPSLRLALGAGSVWKLSGPAKFMTVSSLMFVLQIGRIPLDWIWAG
jgi:hypothetical protein